MKSKTTVQVDEAFHYPAELLELLADAIACLFKAKAGVILFFRGAGLKGRAIDGWEARVQADRDSVRKVEMARDLLTRINDVGEAGIRLRREILKRVCEREDYSTCWPTEEDRARALVGRVREIVNQKDAFTRMNQAYERERETRAEEHRARIRGEEQRQREREQIQKDLYALFSESDPHRRGRAVESVLNRLFASYGASVRQSFTLRVDGHGVVEQIDGVVELDGHLYLVEMKWWGKSIGVPEVSQHLLRIHQRAEARAIIISESPFTDPAVMCCRESLSQKVVVLCGLEEIVRALEAKADLMEVFRRKIQAAVIDKMPLA